MSIQGTVNKTLILLLLVCVSAAWIWSKYFGAFGLIVTLVWLYLEILRLLSKLRRRN